MSDLFPGRAGYVQLREWGFPQGVQRAVPERLKAFSTVHITGNSRLPTAQSELAWRANDPANQNSATFFVNRDGSVWQALGDPLRMDPWANGDVRSPDLSNPRIAALVRDGVNANERTLVAIENVGYEPGYSITAAQEAANRRILAYYHAKAGIPVNRETVIGHFQVNSVTRPNCPAVDKSVLDRIIGATEEPALPANAAPPATFHPLKGRVQLDGTYNAFQYAGMADGKPQLVRLNALTFTGTSAIVIGRAHWVAGMAVDDCYLVSPWVYLPGGIGWREDVWWSKSPIPEPHYDSEEVNADELQAALDTANRRVANVKSTAIAEIRNREATHDTSMKTLVDKIAGL